MLNFKNIIIILVLLGSGLSAKAAALEKDTTIVKSLMEEVYFYNQRSANYLPLVDYSNFSGKTLHINLEKTQMTGLLLQFSSNQSLALFINDKLVTKTKGGNVMWDADSLFRVVGENTIHCTIYNPKLSAKNLSINLLTISAHPIEDLVDQNEVIILNQRKANPGFRNFLILGLVIILACLATLYNYYPRVTMDFLKVSRAIALREMDENLLKSRPLSWINILFYLFFSLLTGYLLVCIFYLAPFHLIDNFKTVWWSIWFWMKVTGVIMMWLLIKFILIRNFSILFNIKFFIASHYFNYIRIVFFILLILGSVMIISYLGFDITNPLYYKTLFKLLLAAICLGALFLMLKLMNTASYKFLHLFSYLCGTEIIPLGVILFLGFNQPF